MQQFGVLRVWQGRAHKVSLSAREIIHIAATKGSLALQQYGVFRVWKGRVHEGSFTLQQVRDHSHCLGPLNATNHSEMCLSVNWATT